MSILNSLKEVVNSEIIEKGMTERQIKIIIAAIELFSDKGFEATTTSEIAKNANVAEGTIYRYYKTKKDLLLAIPACFTTAPFAQILIDDLNEVLDKEYVNFEDFLKAFILNRKNFATENINIIKILFQEIAFHPELREKISQTALIPTAGKIIKILDTFKAKGQIIDIPSVHIAKLIATSIIGYFFTRYIAMIDFRSDENEELYYLAKYIMNGICKGVNI